MNSKKLRVSEHFLIGPEEKADSKYVFHEKHSHEINRGDFVYMLDKFQKDYIVYIYWANEYKQLIQSFDLNDWWMKQFEEEYKKESDSEKSGHKNEDVEATFISRIFHFDNSQLDLPRNPALNFKYLPAVVHLREDKTMNIL